MKNFRKIAPCALSILMAISTTLFPLKSTNVFADDTSSPPTCKDGYEYVESVGKCYKKCQDGWERNSETNRCRKIRVEEPKEELEGASKEEPIEEPKEEPQTEVKTESSTSNSAKSPSPLKTITTCKDGYEYVESVGKCYKKCQDGWERNPETNRCRKATVESDYETNSSSSSITKNFSKPKDNKSSVSTCKDGYEYVESAGKCYKACTDGQIRNPETNRCKKDTSSSTKNNNKSSSKKTNDGADYAVDVPNTGSISSFTAVGAVIALVATGLVFVIFQYRVEIRQFIKKHFKKS